MLFGSVSVTGLEEFITEYMKKKATNKNETKKKQLITNKEYHFDKTNTVVCFNCIVHIKLSVVKTSCVSCFTRLFIVFVLV